MKSGIIAFVMVILLANLVFAFSITGWMDYDVFGLQVSKCKQLCKEQEKAKWELCNNNKTCKDELVTIVFPYSEDKKSSTSWVIVVRPK